MTFALRIVLAVAMVLGGPAACRGVANTNEPSPARQLVVHSWGTENGLPQNTINAIAQTRDGYLWMGTRDGLVRFDGVRFTVFGLSEGLPSLDISALCEDRQGALWIGTIGGGLCRGVKGRIERIIPPGHESTWDTVRCLVEDKQGRMWIGTAGGLGLWQDGQFIQVEALNAVAHTPIRALYRDRRGAIWISSFSLGLLEYSGNQILRQALPESEGDRGPYCLLDDSQGRLWAGVGNGIILCRQGGKWRSYDSTNGVPYAFVTCMAEDADGTIWAGSLDEDLYYFNQGSFHPVRKEDGLSTGDIRALYPDRDGNLWVGTRTGGLNRLSRRKVTWCGVAQGLTNDFTRSVAESADGTTWVATTGGGLYRGGLKEGFTQFAPDPIIAFYAHPEAVLARADGSVWWSGANALLCWKDDHLAQCVTNEPWVRGVTVTAICEDRRGGLWFGNTAGRLVHFQQGKFNPFSKPVGRGPITALAVETNGNLWVGSPGGGLKCIPAEGTGILSITNGLLSRSIRTLYLDSVGSLWIGTAGGGLARLRNGVAKSFRPEQGLLPQTISQILEDDLGWLWLGSNRGIFRVRKSDLDALEAGTIGFIYPQVYGLTDGLPVEECASGSCPSALKTRSGLMCFPTVKGLVFIDPSSPQRPALPPSVLLEEALVDGRVQVPEAVANNSPLAEETGASANRLILRPGTRELELRYTGVSSSPEKLAFRYRLEGLDSDWVEAGSRRVAYYHRLPPGKFLFRVMACNANGVWNKEGATLAVVRLHYWWETTWFGVGTGLALLGLVAVGLRAMERRRYRRRLAVLQTQHAVERERLRISQDMHDHIGSMLTQVSQLSDLGQSEAGREAAHARFERIGSQTRSAVQALDEIVWATNPKNDNLPRFAEYVGRFADEFFEASSVRCWQEIPTNLPNLVLTAEVRHNVFLAVKEGFNNVLKHASATQLWLRLALEGSQVRLEIEDNGRGFDPQTQPQGNGLGNMKARLTECGGSVEVRTAVGKGTRLRFCFPLPSPA